MTDRELLEKAAKVAGIQLVWSNFSNVPTLFKGLSSDKVWNPLEDDGDALRLAVKLRMRVHHDGSCAIVELTTGQKYCWTEAAVHEDSDHFAATRRAIVRAAAAMEKALV